MRIMQTKVSLRLILSRIVFNGIEALDNNNIPKEWRWLRIEIGIQGKVMFLCFKNLVEDGREIGSIRKTTKKDSIHHGFGCKISN